MSKDFSVLDEETYTERPSKVETGPNWDLVEELIRGAPRSRFFELVSLLERLTPDAERVGSSGPPSAEAIRFRHMPDLSFAAGDFAAGELKRVPSIADDPLSPPKFLIELSTTFLGLGGATSPLPSYMTEEIAQEDPHVAVRRDFLDVFHHRLISLLFRLWSRYNYAREFQSDLADPWTRRTLAFVGCDPYELEPSEHIPRWMLLRLTPLLVGRNRGARSLEVALQQILGTDLPELKVGVKQFVGGWVPMDDDERCALGKDNNRLGVDALLGKRVFDRTGNFAVCLEPVPANAYPRLLKDGDLLPVVRDVVRLFSRDGMDFDLELVLDEDAVPTMTLSAGGGSTLGKNSWLRGGERKAQTVIVDNVMSSGPGE
ncbi:MAG: type VI secretion system baseplate subunit TssG [Myxococcota bacterium]